MNNHGSAQGCYELRLPKKCSKCRAYRAKLKQKMRRTPGLYEHDRMHGIGAPGAAKRKQWRRLVDTPGTYWNQYEKRIGRPGLVKRLGELRIDMKRKEKKLQRMMKEAQ